MEWSPDKSKRKNVFQISSISGVVLLLQDDCPCTCKEWFDKIKIAIRGLPSGFDIRKSVEEAERKKSLRGSEDMIDKIGTNDLLSDAESPKQGKGSKLKRSKSQKVNQARTAVVIDGNGTDTIRSTVSLMTSPSTPNMPPDRKKKITERLRNFLRKRPTLDTLREKGIFKGKFDILSISKKTFFYKMAISHDIHPFPQMSPCLDAN